jgi:hypothetical protein
MSKEGIIGVGAVVGLALVLYLISQISMPKFLAALAAVVTFLGWGLVFAMASEHAEPHGGKK